MSSDGIARSCLVIGLSSCALGAISCQEGFGPHAAMGSTGESVDDTEDLESGTTEPGTDATSDEPDEHPPGAPEIEWVACRYPTDPDLVEGVDYECGDLLVPEARQRPGSPILRVHFIRFISAIESDFATVYLDGGPGGDGSSMADLPADAIAFVTAPGDFVIVSQRGTGLSEPALPCDTRTLASIRGCIEAFEGEGIDLAAYNTQASADDVEDLRIALAYEQWNLFGSSYGSRLALEVMRRYPESVRASVLDAVVPASINWRTGRFASFWSAATMLGAACASDDACRDSFGSFEEALVDMTAALDEDPLQVDVMGQRVLIDGGDAAEIVFQLMYTPLAYPVLPLFVTGLRDRRSEVVEIVLPMLLSQSVEPNVARGLYMSVVCDELFNPLLGEDIETVIAAANLPEPLAEYARRDHTAIAEGCAEWPRRELDPEINEPVVSNVRTLLSSGAFDPITPPSHGEEAARTLSNATHVVFANSGHGAILETPDCSVRILLSFLTEPDVSHDLSCSESIDLEFVTADLAAAVIGRNLRVRSFPVTGWQSSARRESSTGTGGVGPDAGSVSEPG
jgi:pimeloyl-ACP methyl ester carboxylesterase